MTNEPTNQERAAWASEALAVFTARTFSGDDPDTMDRDDLECAIVDLITDLLHYAIHQDFNPESLVQQARVHFAAELLLEAVRP